MLKGSGEGVLRKLLGETDIAQQARDARYQPRLLDPEDRVDGAMYVGGRHSRRSQHYRRNGASKSWSRRTMIRRGAQSTAWSRCASSAGASRPLAWLPLG